LPMPKKNTEKPDSKDEVQNVEHLSQSPSQTNDDPRREKLINHLHSLAHGTDTHEVIQLLHDIRTHQDHHKMQKVLESNRDHTIAHQAIDHGQDVIELLVDDYLGQMGIPDDVKDSEAIEELENHLVDTIFLSLNAFHVVVEEIRADVQTVADRFREEGSISRVTDLVEQIRGNMHQEVIKGAVKQLHPEHLSHHIFQEHAKHLRPSDALAAAWVQHANKAGIDIHDHSAAIAFVREELHTHLKEHFAEALDETGQVQPETEAAPINLPLATIVETRSKDPEFNRAFVLLEALRARHAFSLEIGSDPPLAHLEENDFARYVTAVTASDEKMPIEQAALSGVDGVLRGSDIQTYFKQNADSLGTIYIRATINNDPTNKEGYLQIEDAKLRLMAGIEEAREEILDAVPKGTVLRNILEGNEQDTFACLLSIWKKQGGSDISELDRIVDQVAMEANNNLDIDYDAIDRQRIKEGADELMAPIRDYATTLAETDEDIAGAVKMTETARRLLTSKEHLTRQDVTDMKSLMTAFDSQSDYLVWLVYEADGESPLQDMVSYWAIENPLLQAKKAKTWKHALESFLKDTALQIKANLPLAPESATPGLETTRHNTLISPENGNHKLENEAALIQEITKSLESAPDGSLERRVCKLFGCFFNSEFGPKALATLYIARIKERGEEAGTFSDYLEHLDSAFRESIKPGLYEDLLKRNMELQPAGLPDDLEAMGFDESLNRDFEGVTSEVSTMPSSIPAEPTEIKEVLHDSESCTVDTGQHIGVDLAGRGSELTVENGAKLSVLMVDEGATIRLKGPDSYLSIDMTSRHCNKFRIIDGNGRPASDHPNIELGEGVMEKLAS